MFRSALLDYTVTVEHDSAIIAKAVASVSHADENGIQNVTVKLINFGGAKADVQVALDGFAPIENGTLRLEILSGAIKSTAGQATVGGFDVRTGKKIRQEPIDGFYLAALTANQSFSNITNFLSSFFSLSSQT